MLTEYELAVLERARQLVREPMRDLSEATHPKQRSFVDDDSPRIVATCGRRAGKTDGVRRRLVRVCKKGGLAVYFALSRPTAERLMWRPLQELNREYGLGLQFLESKLQVRDPASGGQIWLLGANATDEREKARGHAFDEVALDEAGSYGGYLDYLIEEILDPALQDYGGTLVLTGTPPRVAAGYFFQASTGDLPGWSRHSWTVLDNTLFPRWRGEPDWEQQAAQWFREMLESRGLSPEDPLVLREWLAQWVHDSDALVYKFDRSRNCWSKRPDTQGWPTVMGIDLGFEDDTAITVVAYDETDDRLIELETIKRKHLIASEIAQLIDSMREHYKPRVIRADTGGLGKTLVEEYRQRYGIPILPAEKTAKYDYIEHLNSDLRNGKILIDPKSPLADEWSVLQWDENKHREHPSFPNHAADAFLYAWREAQHFRGKRRAPLPKHGTKEYSRREAKRLELAAMERARRNRTQDPMQELL